ncbi:hypothetical protein GCM10027030_19000 [Luteococcus sediminum]
MILLFGLGAIERFLAGRRRKKDPALTPDGWPWWGSGTTYVLAIIGMVVVKLAYLPVGAGGVGLLVLMGGIAAKGWVSTRPRTNDA